MSIDKMFDMFDDADIPKARKKRKHEAASEKYVQENVVLPDIPYSEPIDDPLQGNSMHGAIIGTHLGVFFSEVCGKGLLHKALIILPCAVGGYIVDNYFKRKHDKKT